ncbi:MAG TPA: crossover junction endodeoxyribonuclease RuvC [Candidatus Acidoferrales bacterium]|nr:crossover junction endodeoxyribonuclease RuvC [Candidatus Acidoferrales bacterium]
MGAGRSRDCRAGLSSNNACQKQNLRGQSPFRQGDFPISSILGIDPGTVATGWGLIEIARGAASCVAHGTIRSSPRERQEIRLRRIYRGLSEVIARYQPQAVSLEKVFFARDPQSALKLGQVRGVALLAAAENQVAVYEYSSAEIKKAAVGYGNASKEQVENMVRALLGLAGRVARDAADALAAALCHFHQHAFHGRVIAALARAQAQASAR